MLEPRLCAVALPLLLVTMLGCARAEQAPIVAGRLFDCPIQETDPARLSGQQQRLLGLCPEQEAGLQPLPGWSVDGFDADGESLGSGQEFADSPGWYFQTGMAPDAEVLLRFAPADPDDEALPTVISGAVPAAVLWVDDGVFHAWDEGRQRGWMESADQACWEEGEPPGCRPELGDVELKDFEDEGLAMLLVVEPDPMVTVFVNGEPGLIVDEQGRPGPDNLGVGATLFGPLPAGDTTIESRSAGGVESTRSLHLLPGTLTSLWRDQ